MHKLLSCNVLPMGFTLAASWLAVFGPNIKLLLHVQQMSPGFTLSNVGMCDIFRNTLFSLCSEWSYLAPSLGVSSIASTELRMARL